MDLASLQPLQRNFYKSQYQALRKEIELLLAEARAAQRNAAIATGVVWTWLATHEITLDYRWCWFIPVAFPLLGSIYSAAVNLRLGAISRYLTSFEEEVCSTEIPGWQTFSKGERRHVLLRSGGFFWIALFLLTIIVAGLGFHFGACPSCKRDY
jgi:hypothetical protein